MERVLANGMKFINDEQVIGKWEFFDCIRNIDDFSLEEKHYSADDLYFREIYLLPEGERYWIYEGWTKGNLLIHYGGDEPILCYKYDIKTIDKNEFLFLYVEDENNKNIQVLRKVSDKKYKKMEIGRRENIDREFISDEAVIGSWLSVGFVDQIKDFDPQKDYSDCLWVKEINFYGDGSVTRVYFDDVFYDKWTKDYLLDQDKSVASKYEIHNINDKEYLFLEWKMGNYVFGGADPSYYVFERKNS